MSIDRKTPRCWDDSNREDRIVRAVIVRMAASLLAEVIAFYSFPFSTQERLQPPAGTPKKLGREASDSGQPTDLNSITDAPLVTDRADLEQIVLSCLETISFFSEGDRIQEKLREHLSGFGNAVSQQLNINHHANLTIDYLNKNFSLDKKIYLDHVHTFMLDGEELLDVTDCYPGAAALEYCSTQPQRYITRKEIIRAVPSCAGTTRSLNDKIARLPLKQRSYLKSLRGVGIKYCG
jgi:hypothetical protein